MKLLLDESLPRPLKYDLSEFYVKTVPEMGWSGRDNGDLLGLASKEFDLFVTTDKNIEYQQVIENYDIAIVVLDAVTNRYKELIKLLPSLTEIIHTFEKGKIHKISAKLKLTS